MSDFSYNVWVDGLKMYSTPMSFEWASQIATLWRKMGFKQVLVDTDDLSTAEE